MGEFLFFAIFIIPALLGVGELIHLLKTYIVAPRERANKYVIVLLRDNSPCKQLAFAAEEFFWRGKAYAQNIIAVDCGVGIEEFHICKSFCEKHNFIYCSMGELAEYLEMLGCA